MKIHVDGWLAKLCFQIGSVVSNEIMLNLASKKSLKAYRTTITTNECRSTEHKYFCNSKKDVLKICGIHGWLGSCENAPPIGLGLIIQTQS